MVMADRQPSAAGADPGLYGAEPSQHELAEEERVRSEVSIAELVVQDLADPDTPSRWSAVEDRPEPGSFEVPLRARTGELIDGG
jgi:hypothetical protein